MSKVFIINKGAHDYSAADEYGELVFCTEGLVDKFNTSQMVRIFNEAFKDAQAHDYILITSLTTLCSVASAIFARQHGRINFLIFRDGRYIERTVVL